MDRRTLVRRLPVTIPLLATALLIISWGREPSPLAAVAIALVHVAVVVVAVVHAEAIAHRVGEPFGTLVLAVAVTVIEVALIVTLMITEGDKAASLARDTVFAAVMIVCHLIVGVSLVLAARRSHTVRFSEQGANALLGTVITLATLSLVMPTFTSSSPGATFTASQLAFSAIASATVYAVFVFVQTRRLRWMFLDEDDQADTHADVQSSHDTLAPHDTHDTHDTHDESSMGLHVVMLVVSLVAVVGLAKILAPSIEEAISWAGAPPSFVGVVIALMVLMPESIAAFRAANSGRMQNSINLALGSALASIGLTIPAIAIASIWLDGPIILGLGAKEIVLLALTAVIGTLTFGSGRATVLQATHHLVVFAAFIFLAIVP